MQLLINITLFTGVSYTFLHATKKNFQPSNFDLWTHQRENSMAKSQQRKTLVLWTLSWTLNSQGEVYQKEEKNGWLKTFFSHSRLKRGIHLQLQALYSKFFVSYITKLFFPWCAFFFPVKSQRKNCKTYILLSLELQKGEVHTGKINIKLLIRKF